MAFLKKEIEIASIRPSIIRDMETVLEFVERWNKKDEEFEVADAAARIETYLRDYAIAEKEDETV